MTHTVLLGDICTKITDGAHWSPKSVNKGIPMASVKDMTDYDIDLSSCRLISEEDYEKLVKNGCKPAENDILIAKDGSYLKHIFVWRKDDIDVALLSSIAILRPDLNLVDPDYLVYFLDSPIVRDSMENYVTGAALPRIVLKNFARLPIELPGIEEQRRVSQILRTLDEKIELNNRMNETLEEISQALFTHYFIDNLEFKTWPRVRLDELCSRVASGGTPSTKREDYYGGGVAWFSTKELQDNFLFDSEKAITDEGLARSAAKLFPEHTVVMAIYAAPTVGRLGILTREAAFNQAACGLVAKSEVGYEFVYLCLLLSRIELNNLANGAAQQNISVGKVRDFKVMKPDQSTLNAFRSAVEPIFAQIRTNATKTKTLNILRDTLLPLLISGKVKL